MERRTTNPWLGLKSYSEGNVLYGRDKEIVDLSQRVLYNTQTIIYGRSGIGKSSLLKAGVFPVLRKHGMFPVYIRLSHSEKDEYKYTNQIIDAVENALSELRMENPDNKEVGYDVVSGYKEEVVPVVDAHNEGLWEYFHRHRFFYQPVDEGLPQRIIPVLVFDQFEEVFTLQGDKGKIAFLFKELESLINDVCPEELLTKGEVEESSVGDVVKGNSLIKTAVRFKAKENNYLSENNFHLIISVREDFLSHLERNSTNMPLLKHNRYCLLPFSEDQAAEVIMKPCPGLVSIPVAKEIISKVTGASVNDFEIDDNPELEVDSAILSLFLSELYNKKSSDESQITTAMVEKFGSDIIADFYKKVMSHISLSSVEYLENRLVTKEGRRDAIYVAQALRHNVKQKELEYLLEQRLLYKYPWRDDMRIEFSHDILCPIITKHRKNREIEAKARRTRRVLVFSMALFLLLLVVIVGFSVKYQKDYVDDDVKIYTDLVKCNTWYEGVNEITEEEASHLPCTYRIYKKGAKAKHPYRIEARDGYGNYTTQHGLSTYFIDCHDETDKGVTPEMRETFSKIVAWEFISDNDDRFCVQEKAYDESGSLIYSYNNTIIDKDNSTFLSVYVDKFGYPIKVRDDKILYLRTTLDGSGYEIKQETFDIDGLPYFNKDSAFATRCEYFPNGIIKANYSIFANGEKMIDRHGNCGLQYVEMTEDGLKPLIVVSFNDKGHVSAVDDWMIMKNEYDEYGRRCKYSYWAIDEENLKPQYKNGVHVEGLKNLLDRGEVALKKDVRKGIHATSIGYNENGKIISMKYYGVDDTLVVDEYGVSIVEDNYDNKGRLSSSRMYDKNGIIYSDTCSYFENGILSFEEKYRINENNDTCWDYRRRICDGNIEEYDYFTQYYEYRKRDEKNNVILEKYYNLDDTRRLKDQVHEVKQVHGVKYDYVYNGSQTEITCVFYDESDSLMPVHKKVLVDSVKCFKLESLYNCNTLTQSLRFDYTDKSFSIRIAENDMKEGKRIVYINSKQLGNPNFGYYVTGLNDKPSYLLDGIFAKLNYDFYGTDYEIISRKFDVVSNSVGSIRGGDIVIGYNSELVKNEMVSTYANLRLSERNADEKCCLTVIRFDDSYSTCQVITDSVCLKDLSWEDEPQPQVAYKRIFKLVDALK